MSYQKRTRTEINAEKQDFSDQIKAHVERLGQLTDDVSAGQGIRDYLMFMGKFHSYSALNAMLIMYQKPNASWVAGYCAWKRMGRYPKKGSGIKVFAPSYRRVGTKEREDGSEKGIHELCGFHLITVFDVSDTEGKPLPEIASFWVEDSEQGEALFAALKGVAEDMGIEVREKPLGRAGGVSYGGHVEVNSENSMLARTSSLAHEMAHELLHQGETRPQTERSIIELEAEAVAYVVCSHFGYEVKAAQYIALWRGDSDKIMKRLESIRQAASTIIGEVEKHVSHDKKTAGEAESAEASLEPMSRVRTAILA